MTDNLTQAKRSKVMASIRSKHNRTTELEMAKLLRSWKITGWRRHLALPGRPDFAWPQRKFALFIDGCFWHGCSKCYKAPRSNSAFWSEKVTKNKARDRKVARQLKSKGWQVMRIMECQLANPKTAQRCMSQIKKSLTYGMAI